VSTVPGNTEQSLPFFSALSLTTVTYADVSGVVGRVTSFSGIARTLSDGAAKIGINKNTCNLSHKNNMKYVYVSTIKLQQLISCLEILPHNVPVKTLRSSKENGKFFWKLKGAHVRVPNSW